MNELYVLQCAVVVGGQEIARPGDTIIVEGMEPECPDLGCMPLCVRFRRAGDTEPHTADIWADALIRAVDGLDAETVLRARRGER